MSLDRITSPIKLYSVLLFRAKTVYQKKGI